ncbi:MAG: PAS domain-containing protein [Woeseia sp.]
MIDQQDVFYRIDADDRIVFVSDEWDRFAAGNEGNGVSSSAVLGRSLWDFIDGLTTQQIYRQIVKRSRAGNAVEYPLRCDAPDRRRFLQMDVRAADGGCVEFRSRILSEEPRAALGLLDPSQPRTNDLITVCSWCEKVRVDGNWVDVEDAIEALGLFQQAQLPALTHGMCQACNDKMNEVIATL